MKAVVGDTATLNSTTIFNGQGPGLVGPGAAYSVGGGGSQVLQWNGDAYYGLNTKTILSDSSSLIINYAIPVQAMGLDLAAFQGFPSDYTVSLYTLTGSLIGSFTGSLNGVNSAFFGWQASGGIASAVVSDTTFGWSPIIDNHSYGNFAAAPEPASLSLLALGVVALVRRRRSTR